MKLYILILFYLNSIFPSFCQNIIQINQVSKDSIEIQYKTEKDLIIGQKYFFKVLSNVSSDQEIFETITNKNINGLKEIEIYFQSYKIEFGLYKILNNKITRLKQISIKAKGTYYKFFIDDKEVFCNKANFINRNSNVTVKVYSDFYSEKEISTMNYGRIILAWESQTEDVFTVKFKNEIKFNIGTVLKNTIPSDSIAFLLPDINISNKKAVHQITPQVCHFDFK